MPSSLPNNTKSCTDLSRFISAIVGIGRHGRNDHANVKCVNHHVLFMFLLLEINVYYAYIGPNVFTFIYLFTTYIYLLLLV